MRRAYLPARGHGDRVSAGPFAAPRHICDVGSEQVAALLLVAMMLAATECLLSGGLGRRSWLVRVFGARAREKHMKIVDVDDHEVLLVETLAEDRGLTEGNGEGDVLAGRGVVSPRKGPGRPVVRRDRL
jgi:hypothetical protein